MSLFVLLLRDMVSPSKNKDYVRIYLLHLGGLEIRVGHANEEGVKRS